MTNVYSDEARRAAREVRARIKRDLSAGKFTSDGLKVRYVDKGASPKRPKDADN